MNTIDNSLVIMCTLLSVYFIGTNQRTGETGDFPGSSYSQLIDEVIPREEPIPPFSPPQEPVDEPIPPPPPRRKRPTPTPDPPVPQEMTPPPPAPRAPREVVQPHDLFKVTLQLPLMCIVCK